MITPRYSSTWWIFIVIHNCIVHPLLPIAELLDVIPSRLTRRVAKMLYDLHDASYPEGAG